MEDYKKRLLIEYWQLYSRISRLEAMLIKYEARELDFTLNCPVDLLFKQYDVMLQYLDILRERIDIELGTDYGLGVTDEFLRLAEDLYLF